MNFRGCLFWALIILINVGFLGCFIAEADFIYKIPHPIAIWFAANVLLCLCRLIDKWITNAVQNRKHKLAVEREKINLPKAIDALIAQETEDSIVKKLLVARKSCLNNEAAHVATPFDITLCISEKEEQAFEAFLESFKQKINTEKSWFYLNVHDTIVNKREAILSFGQINYIKPVGGIKVAHV